MGDEPNGDPIDQVPSPKTNGEKKTEEENSSPENSPPVIINVNQTNEQKPDPQHKAPKPYRDRHDRWHLRLFFAGVTISVAALIAAGAGAIFAYQEIQAIRETATLSVRAYILPNPFPQVWGLQNSPNTFVKLRSAGVTPAKDISLRIRFIPLANQPTKTDFASIAPTGFAATTLEPGKEDEVPLFLTRPDKLTQEERERIRIGAMKFYIYGEIIYFDVFDKRHSTYFCYAFWGERLHENEPNPINNGLRTSARDICWHPDSN